MTGDQIPSALKELIENDLHPVTPLASPWRRAIFVAAGFTVVACVALVVFGFRVDIGEIPSWLSWGCSIIGLGIGITLAGCALRESVPGSALPLGAVVLFICGGVAFHILVGFLTWKICGGAGAATVKCIAGNACFAHEILLALPAFALTIWLIARALPTRRWVAGALGAAGAALTADAVTHLQCGVSDLKHVLAWHSGAIVAFVLFGAVTGAIWQRLKD